MLSDKKDNEQLNEIVQSTMKSKQVWMKSKPYGFDEIKSVLYPTQAISSAKADFFHKSGFLPSQDGFSWKKHQSCIKIGAFFGGEDGIRTHGTL